MDLLDSIKAFAGDWRTLSILVLILCDVVTGIMAALKRGTFAWKESMTFYRTRVVPGILGYGLIYVISAVGLATLPYVGPVLEQIGQYGGWGIVIAALTAAIGLNLLELRKEDTPNAT